jgi:hypothetical protein
LKLHGITPDLSIEERVVEEVATAKENLFMEAICFSVLFDYALFHNEVEKGLLGLCACKLKENRKLNLQLLTIAVLILCAKLSQPLRLSTALIP